MVIKEIDLLQQQIEKLDSKDFDLEAWKTYTTVLLARIFGENSMKIRQIATIEYDYSSWSLRDTRGESSMDNCKKLGREILEASISELENFGLPKDFARGEEVVSPTQILHPLEEELKVSQYKEIKEIVTSTDTLEERHRRIVNKLNSYEPDTAALILSKILLLPAVVQEF